MSKKAQAAQAQSSGKAVEAAALGTASQAMGDQASQAPSSVVGGSNQENSAQQDEKADKDKSGADSSKDDQDNPIQATDTPASSGSSASMESAVAHSGAPAASTAEQALREALQTVVLGHGALTIGSGLQGSLPPTLAESRADLDSLAAQSLRDLSGRDDAAGTGESYAKPTERERRSTPGLKVTSKRAGFRRAGRAWSMQPTVIARSELTEEQFVELITEPMLKTIPVDLDDDGEEF